MIDGPNRPLSSVEFTRSADRITRLPDTRNAASQEVVRMLSLIRSSFYANILQNLSDLHAVKERWRRR